MPSFSPTQVEMPSIPVLAAMEITGVLFLPERITRFSQALDRRLDSLRRAAAAALDGLEFNLASPEQVSPGAATVCHRVIVERSRPGAGA